MADSKVVDLTAQTSPSDTDLFYLVTNAATPYDRKIALSDLRNALNGMVTAATVSGTTDTLALADIGVVKRYTNASAVTVTVPANSTVAFPVGTVISIYSAGAGGVTLSAAGGVTIRNNSAALVQYQEVSIRKDGTDEWVRSG